LAQTTKLNQFYSYQHLKWRNWYERNSV